MVWSVDWNAVCQSCVDCPRRPSDSGLLTLVLNTSLLPWYSCVTCDELLAVMCLLGKRWAATN